MNDYAHHLADSKLFLDRSCGDTEFFVTKLISYSADSSGSVGYAGYELRVGLDKLALYFEQLLVLVEVVEDVAAALSRIGVDYSQLVLLEIAGYVDLAVLYFELVELVRLDDEAVSDVAVALVEYELRVKRTEQTPRAQRWS